MLKNLTTLFMGWFTIATLAAHADSVETVAPVCAPICCEDAYAGLCGKLELSPAWVHIDVLNSGKTDHKMDMAAIKGDLCYRVWKGLQIRPTVMYAHGNNKDRCMTGGCGLGFAIPIHECYWLTPVAGVTWGNLRTSVDMILPSENPTTHLLTYSKQHVSEKFRSCSPYIGLEGSWRICQGFRIVACYQYAWSRTHATFGKNLGTSKSTSKGANISGMFEYDLNCNWSVNIGGAYNNSLSKEKHGLRAYGVKLGTAYWF